MNNLCYSELIVNKHCTCQLELIAVMMGNSGLPDSKDKKSSLVMRGSRARAVGMGVDVSSDHCLGP